MIKVILVIGALLINSICFMTGDVFAGGDNIVLSFGVTEEYLDNIFFDSNSEVDDYITTLSAGVEVRKRTERLKAGLRGLFDAVVYVDNDELNNLDQLYSGYVKYSATERLFVGAEASYKNDSRPDRDVAETGLVLGTDVRKTQRYGAKAGYEFSELSNLSFGAKYRKENYEKQRNDDYDTYSATTRWKHNLGYWLAGTNSRATLEYSRYNYRFSTTDNYSATLGAEKELSELYSFYFDLGGRYSQYVFFNEYEASVKDDGVGGVLKAGVRYRGEYANTRLSVLHDIAPASGRGRTLERTSLIGNFRYRLSERFTSVLRLGYYWNRGDVSVDPYDEKTIRIVPQLIYQIADNIFFDATYSYTQVNSNNNNEDKDRNDFFVNLTFNHTLFK